MAGATKTLNAICLDSLEIPLERLLEHREFHKTQETSRLFLDLYDALVRLEALRDAAAELILIESSGILPDFMPLAKALAQCE